MRPRITFRDIPHSDAIENRILQYAEKLERLNSQIIDFHVVVEQPKKNQHQGNLFQVKMEIKVPEKTIVVHRDLNEDVYGAIRDAFFTARQQLQAYNEKRRGEVKAHVQEGPEEIE